jgi:hypothetical protein
MYMDTIELDPIHYISVSVINEFDLKDVIKDMNIDLDQLKYNLTKYFFHLKEFNGVYVKMNNLIFAPKYPVKNGVFLKYVVEYKRKVGK